MRVALLFAAALATACASKTTGVEPEPPGPCADRAGSYLVKYRHLSGTCGPISDAVVVFGGPTSTQAASACSGESTGSDDGCDITSDISCPADDPTLRLDLRGKIHWSRDGARGGGTVQIVAHRAEGAAYVCESTYEITYLRQ